MTDLAALTGAVKARWIALRAMRRAEGEFAVTESAWCVFVVLDDGRVLE